jgi:fimbrial isopeptide formation D2 family protein
MATLMTALGAVVLAYAPAAHAGLSTDWSIGKTHPNKTYVVGDTVTFTITVTAVVMPSGNSVPVQVVDTLPNGLTYKSFDGGNDGWACTPSGQTVTCSATPDISTGDTSTFTITATLGLAAVPSATNSVTLSADNDENPANNTATDTVTVGAASPSPTPTATPTPTPTPTPSPSVLPTSAARLPFTGSRHEPVPTALAGSALLVAGASLLVFGRRRRRRAH